MIPDSKTFAKLLRDALEGTSARIEGFAVTMDDSTESNDFQDCIRRLLTADKQMTVRTRFAIGDIYNQIPATYRQKHKILLPIYLDFGKKYRQLLKTYGWTSRKWTGDDRNHKHPWSYFVNHYKNAQGVICEHKSPEQNEKDKRVETLTLSSEARMPNGELVLYFETESGKRFSYMPLNDSRHTKYRRTNDLGAVGSGDWPACLYEEPADLQTLLTGQAEESQQREFDRRMAEFDMVRT